MLKEYDQITAFHYAAYRPLLHSKILNEYFDENGKQNIGLDIGCGTGHSSVALAKYCHKVFGIDPSACIKKLLKFTFSNSRILILKKTMDKCI